LFDEKTRDRKSRETVPLSEDCVPVKMTVSATLVLISKNCGGKGSNSSTNLQPHNINEGGVREFAFKCEMALVDNKF
jgi:hypothetical protein